MPDCVTLTPYPLNRTSQEPAVRLPVNGAVLAAVSSTVSSVSVPPQDVVTVAVTVVPAAGAST